jgi:hypothetical protein
MVSTTFLFALDNTIVSFELNCTAQSSFVINKILYSGRGHSTLSPQCLWRGLPPALDRHRVRPWDYVRTAMG